MKVHVTLTTMTPLHIGTGTELLNEYDLKVVGSQTYRLNVDAIWDYVLSGDARGVDQHLLRTPPAQLIAARDLAEHPEFVAYVLAGRPQPESAGAGRVREQIKDAFGRLYLPGSSLKGALRTAIARSLGRKQPQPLRVNDRPDRRGRRNAQRADDWLEADLMRPGADDANHDLLRALQVADSHPAQGGPVLVNVRVVKGDRRESPIDVEAAPPGTTFETTIHLDDYLLDAVAGELGWDAPRTGKLYALPRVCRDFALQRAAREQAYYAKRGLPELARIYHAWRQELQALKGSDTCLLQVGWGGGWESKTVGKDL
ncbi:MAG: type III-A CRISPR-associated RAMP protein Csm5, partial [Anaerolineae bacterium]|nr:type III-A CRISPR-associated RAMP protein Csm5 [Anaerolineae bacterium]